MNEDHAINGAMTLHRLTNDKSLGKAIGSSKKQKQKQQQQKQKQKQQQTTAEKKLELHQMWHVHLLPNTTDLDSIMWEETNV
jgi:hypothetical protein